MYKMYSVGFNINVQVTSSANDTIFSPRLDLTLRGCVHDEATYSVASAVCIVESETWSHDPR